MKKRVLFILKRREDYDLVKHNAKGLSTGLYNSASFMDQMLKDSGIESEMEVAIDNNCIDKLVTKHRPTHVIIEALWVVPSKFYILTKLHPKITWIIRLHSEMPFLAGEGIAMNWIGDYFTFPNIILGINAPRMMHEIKNYAKIKMGWDKDKIKEKIVYMPNYYPQDYVTKEFNKDKKHLDICCFGAVRPLKNHLLQAFGALDSCKILNKKLRFHINAGRIEMKGDAVLHNLRGLFIQLIDSGHEMISHEWRPREQFLELCATMDIGLQVSFSETFNIVGADLISQGVPLVGSNEIPWSCKEFNANPVDSKNIAEQIIKAYNFPQQNVGINQKNLTNYTNNTRDIWVKYFNGE